MITVKMHFFQDFRRALGLGVLTAVVISWCCAAQTAAQPEGETTNRWRQEKVRLLKTLKEEIEPNLIKADVTRLKRNVMRLGSFRREWSKEAEDFLVANAPLAELYLYDYSRIKNSRLNQRILETLIKFPSYKYPIAALAMADSLAVNDKGKTLVIELFKSILAKHPRSLSDYMDFLQGRWAANLPGSQTLSVLLTACEAGAALSFDQTSILDRLSRNSSDLWTNVISSELRACLEGV